MGFENKNEKGGIPTRRCSVKEIARPTPGFKERKEERKNL